MRHKHIKEPLLKRTSIFHADHHVCQLRFKNTRRGKIICRTNLAQIGHHGFGALRAIRAEARPIRLTNREDKITHPRHRQIRQNFIACIQMIKLTGILRCLDNVSVREHNAFWLTCRARRVKHDAGAVIGKLLTALFEVFDQLIISRATLCLDIYKPVQRMVVILTQAAWIDINHMFELMQPILNFDNFVDLLLVLTDHKARTTMLHDISHLFSRGILIQRNGNGTHRLSRNHRPVKMRTVSANDCNKVALIHAEINKPKRQRLDFLLGFGPSPALPDAKFFFSVSRLIGKLPSVTLQQRWNGRESARRF